MPIATGSSSSPSHWMAAFLILATGIPCVPMAQAQGPGWVLVPGSGKGNVPALWLDTTRIERIDSTRLRVWSGQLNRSGLLGTVRPGDEGYYDRMQSAFVVDCRAGETRLEERVYLYNEAAVRREFIRLMHSTRSPLSRLACAIAGIEHPPGE